jgi:hypothetical protein
VIVNASDKTSSAEIDKLKENPYSAISILNYMGTHGWILVTSITMGNPVYLKYFYFKKEIIAHE